MPSSEVMGKFKRGELHSGSKSGPAVKNRKQAIAVMLSEQRTEAKNGGSYPDHPKRRKTAMHPADYMPPGKVSSVDALDDGKHASVSVTHGKRKRAKDEKGATVGGLQSYHQHTSRFIIKKKHASQFPLGKRVGGGADDAEDQGDNGMDEGDESPAPIGKPKLVKTPHKSVSKKPAKQAPGRGPVFAAMTQRAG